MEKDNINTPDFWDAHYSINPYQDIFTPLEREALLTPLAKLIPQRVPEFDQPLNIVDIACGIAYMSDWCNKRGHRVLAVDFSNVAIEESKKRFQNTVQYLRMDIESALENMRESADVIIALEILEHYKQPMKLLNLIYRALKPDGILIFSVPYELGAQAEAPYHYTHWNYEKMTSVMLSARFNEVTYYKTLAHLTSIQGAAKKTR